MCNRKRGGQAYYCNKIIQIIFFKYFMPIICKRGIHRTTHFSFCNNKCIESYEMFAASKLLFLTYLNHNNRATLQMLHIQLHIQHEPYLTFFLRYVKNFLYADNKFRLEDI